MIMASKQTTNIDIVLFDFSILVIFNIIFFPLIYLELNFLEGEDCVIKKYLQ